jgi:putative FmdB family regulatory protein
MPTYEYECTPCLIIYETRHSINDPPPPECPSCHGPLKKVVTAPTLNLKNFGGPTEAKYSKLSISDEIKKETIFQKEYQKIWIPQGAKHNPWDEH